MIRFYPVFGRNMKWVAPIALGLLVAGLRADIVDRIRASVNGEIITQSDVQSALALRRLSASVPKQFSTADLEDLVLRQLIDQKIILLHAAKRPEPIPVSEAEIRKEIEALRSLYKDERTFDKTMADLGLTPALLEQLIREKLLVLKFADMTFRPQVTVSPAEIAEYYHNDFVPQARRSGVMDIPSEEEVAPQLREILTERKISRALDAWLKHQRETLAVRVIE